MSTIKTARALRVDDGGATGGAGSPVPPPPALKTSTSREVFSTFAGSDGSFPKSRLLTVIKEQFGLGLDDDPHLESAKHAFDALPEQITEEHLKSFRNSAVRVTRAFRGGLVLPDFSSFSTIMGEIFTEVKGITTGSVTEAVPQLSKVDPDLFAVSVCSVDGQRCDFGDSKTLFTIDALTHPLSYGLALEEAMGELGTVAGENFVHSHVGKEPSGRGSNERVLDRNNLPHNPCLPSGGIMCASLIKRMEVEADRFSYVLDKYTQLAGGSGRVTFSNSVYLGEKSAADHLYCLGYMMKEERCFPAGTNLSDTQDFYLMMRSLEMTPSMMAVIAATLANAGTNPLTGERIFSERTVRNILSEMGSCGMDDYSGEFAFRVGLPAKSGMSGGVLVVIPGVAGFCSYSPRLDNLHNSVRGIEFCKRLVERFTFHPFAGIGGSFETGSESDEGPISVTKSMRRVSTMSSMSVDSVSEADEGVFKLFTELWWASAAGDLQHLRRLVARSVDVNAADYDSRTALHLAAAEGHMAATRTLLLFGANTSLKDRFGETAEDAAKRGGHEDVRALLHDPPEAIYASRASSLSEILFRAMDLSGIQSVLASALRDVLAVEGFTNQRAPHTRDLFKDLTDGPAEYGLEAFTELVTKHRIIVPIIRGEQVIKDFDGFSARIKEIYDTVMPDESGANADYIPSLAKADPDRFGISVCSVSGQQYDIGDSSQRFGVQSITKVVNYCIAQTNYSEEKVHTHVGREPSGRLFNEICLNEKNLPHNPCINAGAMMTCSMLWPEKDVGARFSNIEDVWEDLTGGTRLPFNNSMYLGEKATADRNFCLGYYMKGSNAFPDWIKTADDLMETLSLYFMTCSIELATEELAIVAATLANGGTHPLTGKKIFEPQLVRNALTLMQSCGMYDGSGEFAFSVGFPCKSGVGGGLMIIIPGIMGLATFSPRLDAQGNSQRGVRVCQELTAAFNFHNYDTLVRGKVDPTIRGGSDKLSQINDLLQAAYTDDDAQIHDIVNAAGISVNSCDYDDRSALHLAATAGHENIVKVLIEMGANKTKKDRWGATPGDNAREAGFTAMADRLL